NCRAKLPKALDGQATRRTWATLNQCAFSSYLGTMSHPLLWPLLCSGRSAVRHPGPVASTPLTRPAARDSHPRRLPMRRSLLLPASALVTIAVLAARADEKTGDDSIASAQGEVAQVE